MSQSKDNIDHRDRIIAGLLWYGTWIASAIIAAGIALGMTQSFEGVLVFGLGAYDVVKGGVLLFILLPIARVALMLVIFLRERDYAYVAISALVLIVIAAGVAMGL